MLLSSPLLLFFVHFTSVLAFLCLSSLYLFIYFSCSLCLSLFLFLLVSLYIICVSSFFVCVFLYYLFVVLPFFVAFICSSWFLWVCICWLDQQPTVRGSWSSLLLEEGHKSLCLLYVSVFFGLTRVNPGQPIWPVTRSLNQVDDRVVFQNFDFYKLVMGFRVPLLLLL